MTSCDFERGFTEIMVQEAARDSDVRHMLERIMLVKAPPVDENLFWIDEVDLRERIGNHYALSQKDVDRAFSICEDRIVEGLH